MELDKSSLYVSDGGGDWEGDSQECLVLLFLMGKGLKRIPNALKRKTTGKRTGNVLWRIKENNNGSVLKNLVEK